MNSWICFKCRKACSCETCASKEINALEGEDVPRESKNKKSKKVKLPEEKNYKPCYEKATYYLSSKLNFKNKVCHVCKIKIFESNELCYFDSFEVCINYIIYILSIESEVVYIKGNGKYLINFLKKYKSKLKDKNEIRIICKFCLLRIINSREIIEILERIFARKALFKVKKPRKTLRLKKIKPRKKELKVDYRIPYFVKEEDITDLWNCIFTLLQNLKSLIISISRNKDPKYVEQIGDVKQQIQKIYDICKFWLKHLVFLFHKLNLKIQFLKSRIDSRKEFEQFYGCKNELNMFLSQSLEMCKIIDNFSYFLDTC